MTTARTLLTELTSLGVSARVDGADLVLRPVPPADVLERCRAAKPELLELLTGLDQRLAHSEVLAFPAHLLAALPVPTTLIVTDGTGCPPRAIPPSQFAALATVAPAGATVGDVLRLAGLELRLVVLDGGAP